MALKLTCGSSQESYIILLSQESYIILLERNGNLFLQLLRKCLIPCMHTWANRHCHIYIQTKQPYTEWFLVCITSTAMNAPALHQDVEPFRESGTISCICRVTWTVPLINIDKTQILPNAEHFTST